MSKRHKERLATSAAAVGALVALAAGGVGVVVVVLVVVLLRTCPCRYQAQRGEHEYSSGEGGEY